MQISPIVIGKGLVDSQNAGFGGRVSLSRSQRGGEAGDYGVAPCVCVVDIEIPAARKVRIESQPEQPLLKRGAIDPIADIEERLWLDHPIL